MQEAEGILRAAGCPKTNLQVRETNAGVIQCYEKVRYSKDRIVSMGKRLEPDEPYNVETINAADADKPRR